MPPQQLNHSKRTIHALRKLTQFLDTHSRQLLKLHEITIPQIMCLDKLRENGGVSVAMLAEQMHLSASTTVGIIDRLERKKLVSRTRCNNDRRSVIVNITDAGRDFLEKTPELLHNKLHQTLDSLSETEQMHLADCLEAVVRTLNKVTMQ